MIGFIVDLTLVMQRVFRLLRSTQGGLATTVTGMHLEQACTGYKDSDTRKNVHDEIRKSVAGINLKSKLDSESTMKIVTDLLETYRFEEERDHSLVATTATDST